MDGQPVRVLVDTGCEQSVLLEVLARKLGKPPCGPSQLVAMLNGNTSLCRGESSVMITLDNEESIVLNCLVAPKLVGDCSLILGMDGIKMLGGVTVDRTSHVVFGNVAVAACSAVVESVDAKKLREEPLEINDSDFYAMFDGERWTVQWKWKDGEPKLKNRCAEYAVKEEHRVEYEEEIQQWIKDGWLEKYDKEIHGEVHGVIPLMAADQPNKKRKVRPVMDYSRELNDFINSNPGADTAICQDKLRKWRVLGNSACMLDLKKAYLQLHVHQSLQRFQAVRVKGVQYVMTRMGFGLNVAPKLMSKVISTVLALDETIESGTDHYLDDIWVNTDVVQVRTVQEHLAKYGLRTKDPEPLDGARVLGLKVVKGSDGQYTWTRDSGWPSVHGNLTKRALYSLCGKLIGHYPVGGWLRVACSYMKRLVTEQSWDEEIPYAVMDTVKDMLLRVDRQDPVKGIWNVEKSQQGRLWCDASSLAIGVVLEIGGQIVEDASWLRREDDGAHINVAELEALLKGLNLAIKWELQEIRMVTDSATVHGWVTSVICDTKRPKVKGMNEMIVKRRLGVIYQLCEEYKLNLSIQLVRSASNKADALTRVPQKWLPKNLKYCAAAVGIQSHSQDYEAIRRIHDEHHLGMDRTHYTAEKILGKEVSMELVRNIVKMCPICQRVDPAPVTWEKGALDVAQVWKRLAVDITHVEGRPYLTIIDCGPSRYTIWIKLHNETASIVSGHLEHVFQERGPPNELLSDNGPCFKSVIAREMCRRWNIEQIFSCAYRSSGNGIVERNHRTIKRMAARTGGSVNNMVFWYNNTPSQDGIVPADQLYSYKVRLPQISNNSRQVKPTDSNPYSVGDSVYVKPAAAKCTSVWKLGKVTAVKSNTSVEVNGVNRHVADLRLAWPETRPGTVEAAEQGHSLLEYDVLQVSDTEEAVPDLENTDYTVDTNMPEDAVTDESMDMGQLQENNPASEDETLTPRTRRPPAWMADYVC